MTWVPTRDMWVLLFLACALAIGALLRCPDLDRRPMHNDEANQAYKTGMLLETGTYQYDPVDHHGPSLYYFTLPIAWLRGQLSFADTTIGTYRGLTVLFGLLLIPLLYLARDALGGAGVVAAGIFTAVSPAMVYFSRFYIQEMLLVFFNLALLVCIWRYVRRPGVGWASGIGVSLGLMHATKETFVLALAALGAALFTIWLLQRRREIGKPQHIQWSHVCIAAALAALVSITFFTSFFTHWRGPLDSILTYATYLGRAGAEQQGSHHHPFWFYLRILTYSNPAGRLTWGEDVILVCGVIALGAAWLRPRLLLGQSPTAVRALSIYTVLLTLIYSIIPYKTPWCLLSFWLGWILLAGAGLQVLLLLPSRRWIRMLIMLFAWLGMMQLAQRAVLASFRYAANQRNPYVYAQTGMDFMRLVDHVRKVADVHPEERRLAIRVVAAPDRTWPLPWYLRGYPNTGYWHDWSKEVTENNPAVVIADLEAEERVSTQLSDNYIPNYYGLRPEVLLTGHYRADLWKRFVEAQSTPEPGRTTGNEQKR